MKERVILHSDCNNFYASVESLYHPEYRGRPLAVCGDVEKRHGIVLAKNQLAKAAGIRTGYAIWQAKRLCPGLVVVPPDYPKYVRFSRAVRQIYAEYTDQVEAFGMDEAWMDLSASARLFGDGEHVADDIRRRVRKELGITVSIGVSFNKVFSKLGSDLKKPDATTVIHRDRYRSVVWPLPVGELLYVGRSTQKRLHRFNIVTIGELANTDPYRLEQLLGKWGRALWICANGLERSPVLRAEEAEPIKSIGNSTTTPRDLVSLEDARITLCVLSESVAARLREQGLNCGTVQIWIRDADMISFERQASLPRPTQLASTIYHAAMDLLAKNYGWQRPVRNLGVRAAHLERVDRPRQLTLFTFDEEIRDARRLQLERTVDSLRARFGHYAIQRAMALTDPAMAINPHDNINPVRPPA